MPRVSNVNGRPVEPQDVRRGSRNLTGFKPVPAYLAKTRLCRFHGMGRCQRGSECQFAHSKEDLKPIPIFFRSQYCPLKDACTKPDCRYAHTRDELRPVTHRLHRIIVSSDHDSRIDHRSPSFYDFTDSAEFDILRDVPSLPTTSDTEHTRSELASSEQSFQEVAPTLSLPLGLSPPVAGLPPGLFLPPAAGTAPATPPVWVAPPPVAPAPVEAETYPKLMPMKIEAQHIFGMFSEGKHLNEPVKKRPLLHGRPAPTLDPMTPVFQTMPDILFADVESVFSF